MSELDVGCESEGALLLLLPKCPQPPDAAPDLPGGAPALGMSGAPRAAPAAVVATRLQTLRPVFVSVATFMTAIAMTVPTRPKLILAAAGGDVSRASYFTGVVDGMTALVELFTNPVLGAVSDEIGRRPVLILSQFGELGALLIIARLHKYYAGYILAYLLIGLTGVFVLTVNTIVADVSMEGGLEVAASSYGTLGAVYGASFMVGPVLGGYLEDRLYPTASFHVAAAMVAVSILWTSLRVPETLTEPVTQNGMTSHAEQRAAQSDVGRLLRVIRSVNLNPIPRIRRVFSGEALRWLAAAIALGSLAQGSLNSIFFLYLHTRVGWGSSETGSFLSLVGLSLLISQGVFAKRFVRSIGETATILVGFTFAVLHYAVYALADSEWIVYTGLVFGCISFVGDPAIKGLIARQVPVSEQGALQGGLSGLATLLRPFSPLFGTTIFGYANSIGKPGIVFWAITVLSSVSLLVVSKALFKPGMK